MPISSGIERALQVIYYVASPNRGRKSDFGVSEIARGLDLSKTVVHRILTTLVTVDFLAVDPETRRYRLGPGAVIVGHAALEQINPYRVARPYMEKLGEATGETITLSIRRGGQRVYIDQIISEHEVRMSVQVGDASPLHAGSPAKAILAAVPQAEAQEYLNQQDSFVRFTPQTIVDRLTLEADLVKIRRVGYAVSYGERQADAFSVAAPILQAGGSVFGAISVCGPAQRFDDQRGVRYGRILREAAEQVSRELGYQGDWFAAGG